MIKKIILYFILIFGIYKGLEVYATFTTAQVALECGDLNEAERIKNMGTDEEKLAYQTKFFHCVRNNQNIIQKLFYKFPKVYQTTK